MYKIGLATLEFTECLLYLAIWKIIFVYILIVQGECLEKPECKCLENEGNETKREVLTPRKKNCRREKKIS